MTQTKNIPTAVNCSQDGYITIDLTVFFLSCLPPFVVLSLPDGYGTSQILDTLSRVTGKTLTFTQNVNGNETSSDITSVTYTYTGANEKPYTETFTDNSSSSPSGQVCFSYTYDSLDRIREYP